MILEVKYKTTRHVREKLHPAFRIRFLGYKGVVVVDYRLHGIKMRLRESQCNFTLQDVDEAKFENSPLV
jgi:hypothetical protein